MKKLLFLLLCISCSNIFAQQNDVLERLSALHNNGKIWYNIDGYSVTSEIFKDSFDEKGLKKVFRKHQISDTDLKAKKNQIGFDNWYIESKERISENNFQFNHYYFVKNSDNTITVIWFIKNGKTDIETEEKLVNLIMENKIPEENFVPMQVNAINFAGRKIELEGKCYWTALNIVQCPSSGEMNWSLHRTLTDAQEAIENQLNLTKLKKGGKVTSEEIVTIRFEGVLTKAKKVTYDFTGATSALAGMSGGKFLTIYYVAANVRNKNISCVMSFWNNDSINPETKLPSLLEKIMALN